MPPISPWNPIVISPWSTVISEPATLILMPNCYYLPLNYKRQQKRKTHFTEYQYFNSMQSWRNQTQKSDLPFSAPCFLYFFFFLTKLFRPKVCYYSFKFFFFLFFFLNFISPFSFRARNFTPLSLSLATPWVKILAQGTNSDVVSSTGQYF